jgi:hypothetical protein
VKNNRTFYNGANNFVFFPTFIQRSLSKFLDRLTPHRPIIFWGWRLHTSLALRQSGTQKYTGVTPLAALTRLWPHYSGKHNREQHVKEANTRRSVLKHDPVTHFYVDCKSKISGVVLSCPPARRQVIWPEIPERFQWKSGIVSVRKLLWRYFRFGLVWIMWRAALFEAVNKPWRPQPRFVWKVLITFDMTFVLDEFQHITFH